MLKNLFKTKKKLLKIKTSQRYLFGFIFVILILIPVVTHLIISLNHPKEIQDSVDYGEIKKIDLDNEVYKIYVDPSSATKIAIIQNPGTYTYISQNVSQSFNNDPDSPFSTTIKGFFLAGSWIVISWHWYDVRGYLTFPDFIAEYYSNETYFEEITVINQEKGTYRLNITNKGVYRFRFAAYYFYQSVPASTEILNSTYLYQMKTYDYQNATFINGKSTIKIPRNQNTSLLCSQYANPGRVNLPYKSRRYFSYEVNTLKESTQEIFTIIILYIVFFGLAIIPGGGFYNSSQKIGITRYEIKDIKLKLNSQQKRKKEEIAKKEKLMMELAEKKRIEKEKLEVKEKIKRDQLAAEERQKNISNLKMKILDLSKKYERLEIVEIIEITGITDEKLMVSVIKSMLSSQEISGNYLNSTKSILFDNSKEKSSDIEEIMDDLDEEFDSWNSSLKKE